MTRLVLLSGLLCDEAAWAPVAERLGDMAEIEIISFAGFRSIGDMADHVLASVDGDFALAGHSMGGRVALEVVRKAPERVSALALLNIGIHPVTAQEPIGRARLMEISRTEGMAALARAWLPPMMGAEAGLVAGLMPGLTEMVCRMTPESFAGQVHALLTRPDAAAALMQVKVPLLLASGGDDAWSPPAQHEAMLPLAPHASLVIIPGGGHMMPVEQPGRVAQALREWLSPVS